MVKKKKEEGKSHLGEALAAEKAVKEIKRLKIKGVSAKTIDIPKDKFTYEQKARIRKAREQLKSLRSGGR